MKVVFPEEDDHQEDPQCAPLPQDPVRDLGNLLLVERLGEVDELGPPAGTDLAVDVGDQLEAQGVQPPPVRLERLREEDGRDERAVTAAPDVPEVHDEAGGEGHDLERLHPGRVELGGVQHRGHDVAHPVAVVAVGTPEVLDGGAVGHPGAQATLDLADLAHGQDRVVETAEHALEDGVGDLERLVREEVVDHLHEPELDGLARLAQVGLADHNTSSGSVVSSTFSQTSYGRGSSAAAMARRTRSSPATSHTPSGTTTSTST